MEQATSGFSWSFGFGTMCLVFFMVYLFSRRHRHGTIPGRRMAFDPVAFRKELAEEIVRDAGGQPGALQGPDDHWTHRRTPKGIIFVAVFGLVILVLCLASLAVAAARYIPEHADPSVARTAILSIVTGLVLLVAVVGVVVITVVRMILKRQDAAPEHDPANEPAIDRTYTPPPALAPAAGPRQCPVCESTIPEDSPEGLCPKCVLGRCLQAPASPVLSPHPRETASYGGPSVAPLPGDLAAKFAGVEILELLGQGGMGAVYKARQTKLDRIVAVKVLPHEWGKDPAFAERFAREAKALARLNHPHIVAVHDFGESDGLFYLVMEYVDGANLRNILTNGGLEPHEALAIIPQVCDALQYAHEEGIVHRDIKPENILLDSKGRVKIADFGLAKLTNRPRATFTLTGSQQIMGTLDYMAPEQRLSPQQVDHRADIYSLGVVFYEMLTGELPLGRFAPPSSKVGVDPQLDGIVFRALEREPAQRYQRISEVKTALRAVAVNGAGDAGVRGLLPGSPLDPGAQACQRLVCIPIFLGSVWDRQYPGLLRLEGESLVLEYRSGYLRSKFKENVILIKYLRRIELHMGWFRTSLVLQTASLKLLAGIPTSDHGRVVVRVARRDAQVAAQMIALIERQVPGLRIRLPKQLVALKARQQPPRPVQILTPRPGAAELSGNPVHRKLRSLFNSVYTMFFSRAKNGDTSTSEAAHERSPSQT